MIHLILEEDEIPTVTSQEDPLCNDFIIDAFSQIGIERWHLVNMFESNKRSDSDKMMFSEGVLELKFNYNIPIIETIRCINEEIRDFIGEDGGDSVAVKIFQSLMTSDLIAVFREEATQYGFLKKNIYPSFLKFS